MLSSRLRQTQADLQLHLKWLDAFKTGRSVPNARSSLATLPSCRTFSGSCQALYPEGGSGPLARAQRLARRREFWKKKKEEISRTQTAEAAAGRSEAQRRKRERWEARKAGAKPLSENTKALGVREELLQAVREDQGIERIIALYNELPKRRPLNEGDFVTISQATLQALRTQNHIVPAQRQRDITDAIVSFAQTMVNDVKDGNIVSDVTAHTQLLAVFKESGVYDTGIDFFRWLEAKDSTDSGTRHSNSGCYAVGIELLALNGQPLAELETLYQTALVRFPGSFNQYHLSPEAVVPDRAAKVPITGIPSNLLTAIITARLLRGQSRDAYLGLDVALRLQPAAAPPRVFSQFLWERPWPEAYTVWALACRAGIKLPVQIFRELIANIRKLSGFRSAAASVALVRTILAAMDMKVACDGLMHPSAVSELAVALTSLFRNPGFDSWSGKEKKKLADLALLTIKKALEVFARYGVAPPRAVFHSVLVNIAGHGRSKATLSIVMKDMEALGIEKNDVTRRTMLTIAGIWQDKKMLEECWEDIVKARRELDSWPDANDFFALGRAAHRTDLVDFAKQQFDAMRIFLPADPKLHGTMEHALSNPKVESWEGEPANFDKVYEGLTKIAADLQIMDERTKDRPAVRDLSTETSPLMLFPAEGPLRTSEDNMRTIYDELTTDGAAPVKGSTEAFLDELDPTSRPGYTTPDVSLTNVPYDQLRYDSWKCINYLLQLAERRDAEYEKAVDAAIAEGRTPPFRNMGFARDDADRMGNFGISDAANGLGSTKDTSEASLEEARKEILRLRGLGRVPE